MSSELNLRLRNPLSAALADSKCIFRWCEPGGIREFQFPHSVLDAFGGLRLLKSMSESLHIEFTSDLKNSTDGLIDRWRWKHFWTNGISASSEQTFTQLFCSMLIRSKVGQLFERFSFAVALDSRDLSKTDSCWGNSLVLVTFERRELENFILMQKNEWREMIRSKADRTLNVMLKRPATVSVSSKADLLISSIGPLENYSWAPNVTPQSFTMIPTPIHHHSANVILWSRNNLQALSTVGHAGHLLVGREHEVYEGWRNLFHEP